jgi:hypothetical protein
MRHALDIPPETCVERPRPGGGGKRSDMGMAGRSSAALRAWQAGLAGVAVLGAALGAVGAGRASDGLAAPIAAAIDAHLAAGDGAAALAEAERLVAAVWAVAPLTFASALLVDGPPAGYGLFRPRPEGPFRPGEPIRIYAEPKGFAHGQAGDRHEIAFDIDLAIFEAASGRRIAAIPGIQTIRATALRPVREFPASITYEWAGAPAGTYRLVTTLRDRHSGKAGSFELTVEIAPAAP